MAPGILCAGRGDDGRKSRQNDRRAMRYRISLATFRSKKEKLRGGWVQSANFASECPRKLLIL